MPDQDVQLGEPAPGGRATLAQLAMATLQRAKTEISVCMPADVVSWSPPVPAGPESKPAMVFARPHYKYARVINQPADINPGEVVDATSARSLFAVGSLPVIPNVPVLYPGLSGMQIRGPLEVGETGILIVSDKSIDDWIQTGGPVDPVLHHRHNMTDAIFLPGLRYGLNAQQVSPTTWLIGKEDGTAGMSIDTTTFDLSVFTAGAQVEIDAATLIKLGVGAALGVARLTDTVGAAASMNSFITAVVVAIGQIAALLNAPGPVVGAPGSVTPVTPPTDFGLITSASSKVQAE